MIKDTAAGSISYAQIKEAFTKEASSLVSGETIQTVLQTEEQCFQNAALLEIPVTKFVGYNTARHCKDLLRRQQPLPILYFLFSLLTEAASLLLPYSILLAIAGHLPAERLPAFLYSLPYALCILIPAVLCNHYKKRLLYRQLQTDMTAIEDSNRLLQKKHRITGFRQLLHLLAAVFAAAGCILVQLSGTAHRFPVTLLSAFLFYITCILLSGIHNVIYSGHAISFFHIGICLLTHQSSEKLQNATAHYLSQRFQQLLSISGKTTEHLKNNPELQKKLCASVYSHLVTQRIYDILAILLLLAIDVICILRLHTFCNLPLLLFFILSLLLTLGFFIALTSTIHLLRRTKQ